MFFQTVCFSMVVIPIKLNYLDTPFLRLIIVCHLGVSWVHMAAGDFSSVQQTVTHCQQVKLLDTSQNILQSLYCLLLRVFIHAWLIWRLLQKLKCDNNQQLTNWRLCDGKEVWPNLRLCESICLEGFGKLVKHPHVLRYIYEGPGKQSFSIW
jgi:hypothetical protein